MSSRFEPRWLLGPGVLPQTHRYFARVYALCQKLDLQPGATYKEVLPAMEGRIIEQAELVGTYAKAIQRAA